MARGLSRFEVALLCIFIVVLLVSKIGGELFLVPVSLLFQLCFRELGSVVRLAPDLRSVIS